jgi:hypothetical protein
MLDANGQRIDPIAAVGLSVLRVLCSSSCKAPVPLRWRSAEFVPDRAWSTGRRDRGSTSAPPGGHHRDAIRIPMMIVAVVGSLITLYVIWRIRSLRKRPSAQWRQQPIPRNKIWSENAQVAMAVVTLVLVAAELFSHLYIFRFVR